MTPQGLNKFLALLESHCHSSGLRFLGSDWQSLAIEVDRQRTQVTYGYEAHTKELFLRQLQTQSDPVASIVLRSFTDVIDPISQLPIKELRGYVLKRQGDRLEEKKNFLQKRYLPAKILMLKLVNHWLMSNQYATVNN